MQRRSGESRVATHVLSISSSRADNGILFPVWRALSARNDVDLHVFFTGMHQAEDAPVPEEVAESVTVHRGGADMGGSMGHQAGNAMAAITLAASGVFASVIPDVILVIGDRLDMLPAAVASLPFNIPLVHLHGGEVTEGAIDDRARHAMTKLAHFHCVSTEGARRRLLAMGEEDWRIVVTGAPGLDTLKAAPELSAAEIAAQLDLPTVDGLRLVTVHPETNSPDPLAPLEAVLAALEARPGPTLFTAPNSDPGGAEMGAQITQFVAKHDGAYFCPTLGSTLYPNVMRHALFMLGNSSSGVIEAALFGLPVIDVGDRQVGREVGVNVVSVPNQAPAVIEAIDRLGAKPRRAPAGSLYGDGSSGKRVAEVLANLPERDRLLRKKLVLRA